jgi:predicted alpha-1,2-mannosidase
MVQFSPDTIPSDDNFAGGYTYSDTKLRGFSLTHFSGAGCAVYQDVPLLPTTEPVTEAPTARDSSAIRDRYVPSFSHEEEQARPGRYSVTMDPGTEDAIEAELTATTRTGAMRLRYPEGKPASLLVNGGGSAMANGDASVRIDPERREISGFVESGRFCYNRNSYEVHFVARFNRDFEASGTWLDDQLSPGSRESSDHADNPLNYQPVPGGPPSIPGDPSNGAQAGAYVTFADLAGKPVQARIGVSFTNIEGARRNLDAEGDAGFGKLRQAATDRWEKALGKVRVSGGKRADLRTFYTALYHALLHPNVFSDADGRYAGMGTGIERSEETRYANFSAWDIYRTQFPLLAMLFPGRASEMAGSLVANADESGCLPRWPVANGQTSVMVGDPSAPMIASAEAFGADEFPRDAALAAMLRGAREHCETDGRYVEREAIADYLSLGYIPHERNADVFTHNFVSPELPWGAAATTLEFAIADHAIARFADSLGDDATAAEFTERAGAWRNLLNPATQRATPRLASGVFLPGQTAESETGFVEGSSEQYTWSVPHDPAGLIGTIGGAEVAAERLDRFFEEINAGPDSAHAYLGNEPTLGTPWLYAWLGRPSRTQELVRRALMELYEPTPGGFPGNDDGGAMSAWWVFGALGMYPAIPGENVLVFGSPLFRKAVVRLGEGDLRIEAKDAARDRPYVKGLEVGGRARARPWARFGKIADGGSLRFKLGSKPTDWGAETADAPPSYGVAANSG